MQHTHAWVMCASVRRWEMKDGRRVGGEGSENAADSASKLQIKQEEKSRKKEKRRRKREEADLLSPL